VAIGLNFLADGAWDSVLVIAKETERFLSASDSRAGVDDAFFSSASSGISLW
jgi:hypothetical protein